MPAEKIIHFSVYQPKPKGSPPSQNAVNLALQGEGVNLAKSPVNVGTQSLPDTTPLANSAEPEGDAPEEVHLKTNVLPIKAAEAKAETPPLSRRPALTATRSTASRCLMAS
jgi:hypothetical protein